MFSRRLAWMVVAWLACWDVAPAAHAQLRATVRLESGLMHLQNVGDESLSITGYTLSSASMSLRPQEWQPITGRLDQVGSGLVDSDGSWVILSPMQPFPSVAGDLSEGIFTGDGGFIDPGVTVGLGGVWNPNGLLDVELTIADADNNLTPIDLYYLPSADFNLDGIVDARDYVVWRNSYGLTGTGLLADANGDGNVDDQDYLSWKSEYGQTEFLAPGSLFLPPPSFVGVPEPALVTFVLGALACGVCARRWRSR